MSKLIEILQQLAGWRRYGVAFGAGMLSAMSLPPANLWPVLFITIPVLTWLLDGVYGASDKNRLRAVRPAFATGWWFGFGYFSISLYWIGFAFLVDAKTFAALLPLAVTAMPAGLALFWGAAAALAILLWKKDASRPFLLAMSFAGFEWLRGNVLTGFPWNAPGYAALEAVPFAQWASLSGIYGLTLMVFLWAGIAVLVFEHHWRSAMLIMASIIAAGIYGAWRLADRPGLMATTVRIVQPDIRQVQKWDRRYREQNIDTYFSLSRRGPDGAPAPLDGTDVLIWPESALPVLAGERADVNRRIAGLLPENTRLVMGAIRREPAKPGVAQKFYNSVIVTGPDGRQIKAYDKFHLVPFGEYLPLAKWLEPLGLRKVVSLPQGFSAGTGPQTIRAGSIPAFSPLICYEIIFPGHAVDLRDRPEWIVNVTNDGWFGKSAGPHQHLAQARFRAIEEGLGVIRAANTGISAVMDAHGRILNKLPLARPGVIDARIPGAARPGLFAIYHNWIFFVNFVCVLTFFGVIRRGKRL